MEAHKGDDGGDRHFKYWWWGLASSVQMGWGIRTCRKGYSGDSRLMPLKAFGVASLFLGAATTAIIGTLKASEIHSVEDLKTVGANIRAGMGVPPRRSNTGETT